MNEEDEDSWRDLKKRTQCYEEDLAYLSESHEQIYLEFIHKAPYIHFLLMAQYRMKFLAKENCTSDNNNSYTKVLIWYHLASFYACGDFIQVI